MWAIFFHVLVLLSLACGWVSQTMARWADRARNRLPALDLYLHPVHQLWSGSWGASWDGGQGFSAAVEIHSSASLAPRLACISASLSTHSSFCFSWDPVQTTPFVNEISSLWRIQVSSGVDLLSLTMHPTTTHVEKLAGQTWISLIYDAAFRKPQNVAMSSSVGNNYEGSLKCRVWLVCWWLNLFFTSFVKSRDLKDELTPFSPQCRTILCIWFFPKPILSKSS